MGTSYPGGQDSFQRANPNDPLNGPSHAGQHDNAYDAIEAIETELGTNPSGSDATVAARLSAIEAGTNLATGAVTSAKIADGTITSTDVAASTFAAFGTVGNLLTANQAGGYSGWGSDGTLDYWGGGEFAVTSPSTYVFSSDRYPVTPGDVVTIQAELQPVGAGDACVVTQFFTALSGGSAVGAERFGTNVAPGGNALSSLTTVVPATAVAMAFLIYGNTATLHVRHPGI